MNFKYDVLFTVNFKHSYFKNGSFNGFKVTPVGETALVMRNYGLVFKAFADRFILMYDTAFAGSNRDRASVLAENILMDFRVDLIDQAFYNYTGGLPAAINDTICFFSNAGEDRAARNVLHQEDFVSVKDFIAAASVEEKYFSRPFGHVKIRSNATLEKDLDIRFAAKKVFWQYILVADHLRHLNAPVIIDKTTGKIFRGPENIELPGSLTGKGFMSTELITMTSTPNRSYQLVDNYESGNDRYKIIIDALPNPYINNISQNFSKENFSGENNVITIIL